MISALRRSDAKAGLLCVASALLLAGCAAAPVPEPPAPEPVVAPVAPPAPEPPPDPEYGNFDPQTLYELLVAELSLRRGDFPPALDRYAAQARTTRDPGVVAKAARLASVTGDDARALELGLLWARVAPRDPEARQTAAVALLGAGDFDAALGQLRALHELEGRADFRRLAARLDEIDPGARADVIRALEELQGSWPDDDELRWARATLLERAGRVAEALAVLDAATAAALGTDALLLRAGLLEDSGDAEAAAALLGEALAAGNDTPRLRYRLARLLIDVGDLDAARGEFERLLEIIGDNTEVLLSLALITLEQDRIEESRGWLERMLRTGRRPDTAHYFLGVLAETDDDVGAALASWTLVEPGFEFSRAQGAAAALLLRTAGPADLRAYLDDLRARHSGEDVVLWLLEGQALIDAEQPEAAVETLAEALELHPDLPELLYARAMAHDAAGSLEGLERDLGRILEADPDDAMALNALGYTLGDRTDRLDEARALVERALELAPQEPAYVDSMGWIEYRAGNHERAVELLEQAYADFPNHEVAAHLGEALWASGARERAFEVWRSGLVLEQTTDVLLDTLDRLLTTEEREALETGA